MLLKLAKSVNEGERIAVFRFLYYLEVNIWGNLPELKSVMSVIEFCQML